MDSFDSCEDELRGQISWELSDKLTESNVLINQFLSEMVETVLLSLIKMERRSIDVVDGGGVVLVEFWSWVKIIIQIRIHLHHSLVCCFFRQILDRITLIIKNWHHKAKKNPGLQSPITGFYSYAPHRIQSSPSILYSTVFTKSLYRKLSPNLVSLSFFRSYDENPLTQIDHP